MNKNKKKYGNQINVYLLKLFNFLFTFFIWSGLYILNCIKSNHYQYDKNNNATHACWPILTSSLIFHWLPHLSICLIGPCLILPSTFIPTLLLLLVLLITAFLAGHLRGALTIWGWGFWYTLEFFVLNCLQSVCTNSELLLFKYWYSDNNHSHI